MRHYIDEAKKLICPYMSTKTSKETCAADECAKWEKVTSNHGFCSVDAGRLERLDKIEVILRKYLLDK